jgi:ribosomal protein S18 acetylase RimI-like enzyme
VRFVAFRRHALTHDPDRFWVAESARDREVVGFGIAMLRDRLWYLAALHVRPGWQGRGIGRELLRRCQESIPARADVTRIVISDALNPHSNLLYVYFTRAPA